MKYFLAVSNDLLNLINFKLKWVKSFGTESPWVFWYITYMWSELAACAYVLSSKAIA